MDTCTLKTKYYGGRSTYMAKKIQKTNSGMDIPDYQFEALARCLLPKIQKYYESEEGRKDLEEYRAEKAKQTQTEKKIM